MLPYRKEPSYKALDIPFSLSRCSVPRCYCQVRQVYRARFEFFIEVAVVWHRVVWYSVIDVSEKRAASIFKVWSDVALESILPII
jgi:hypothetical protein